MKTRFKGVTCDQSRFRSELRAGGGQLIEYPDFGFTNNTAGENARVCSSRYGQSAIFQREPCAVNADGWIEQPAWPEFPMPPAFNLCHHFPQFKISERAAKQLKCNHQTEARGEQKIAAVLVSAEQVDQPSASDLHQPQNQQRPDQ